MDAIATYTYTLIPRSFMLKRVCQNPLCAIITNHARRVRLFMRPTHGECDVGEIMIDSMYTL